jgi:hypothetical protein
MKVIVITLMLVGLGGLCLLAQLPPGINPLLAGEAVQGVMHGEGDEKYWTHFDNDGTVVVEVSGIPADCAIQVGSQGFQESDRSPNDWTDGQPGQTVRHSFRVQRYRPGTIWVMLRARAGAANVNGWSGVACSANGPYYTTPERGRAAARAPATFEGRPVLPPITFRVFALDERKLPPKSVVAPGTQSAGTDEDQAVAEYRRLLPAVLQAERKPWHTRFEFPANAVKSGSGYHVNYKTYCLIETGPDTGKDYACYEFDSVLDIGTLKAAVADMKRRLGR